MNCVFLSHLFEVVNALFFSGDWLKGKVEARRLRERLRERLLSYIFKLQLREKVIVLIFSLSHWVLDASYIGKKFAVLSWRDLDRVHLLHELIVSILLLPLQLKLLKALLLFILSLHVLLYHLVHEWRRNDLKASIPLFRSHLNSSIVIILMEIRLHRVSSRWVGLMIERMMSF
jgi:hypothetical protein